MSIDRIRAKIGSFIDFSFDNIIEIFDYEGPETAGTIRVKEVKKSTRRCPGFDIVKLDFPGPDTNEESPWIYRVPSGIFHPNQIVEIVVKKSEYFGVIRVCRVSLKPFSPRTYGKGFSRDEAELGDVFIYNKKDEETSPRFFEKFFPYLQ